MGQNFRLMCWARERIEAARPFSKRAARTMVMRHDHHFVDFGGTYRCRRFVWSIKAALIHMVKGSRVNTGKKIASTSCLRAGLLLGIWNTVSRTCRSDTRRAPRNPTGRMATPQEVANAAVFPQARLLVYDRFELVAVALLKSGEF